jgi:hypothetical protein
MLMVEVYCGLQHKQSTIHLASVPIVNDKVYNNANIVSKAHQQLQCSSIKNVKALDARYKNEYRLK